MGMALHHLQVFLRIEKSAVLALPLAQASAASRLYPLEFGHIQKHVEIFLPCGQPINARYGAQCIGLLDSGTVKAGPANTEADRCIA